MKFFIILLMAAQQTATRRKLSDTMRQKTLELTLAVALLMAKNAQLQLHTVGVVSRSKILRRHLQYVNQKNNGSALIKNC